MKIVGDLDGDAASRENSRDRKKLINNSPIQNIVTSGVNQNSVLVTNKSMRIPTDAALSISIPAPIVCRETNGSNVADPFHEN